MPTPIVWSEQVAQTESGAKFAPSATVERIPRPVLWATGKFTSEQRPAAGKSASGVTEALPAGELAVAHIARDMIAVALALVLVPARNSDLLSL